MGAPGRASASTRARRSCLQVMDAKSMADVANTVSVPQEAASLLTAAAAAMFAFTQKGQVGARRPDV